MRSTTTGSALGRLGHGVTEFMAAPGGRVARFALGLGMIVPGVVVGPVAGYVLAGFGLVPLATGTFNLCPLAPLWGGHFSGRSYCDRRSARESG
jgi:hypothetical protein